MQEKKNKQIVNKVDVKRNVDVNPVADSERLQNLNYENLRPNVIELSDFDPFSPFSEKDVKQDEIKFHCSPRNMDQVEFINKLNTAKSNKHKDITSPGEQSVEGILGNIPKEYFRIENRYESIDAVLDHIDMRRENFMRSIGSSPNAGSVSKTIEPIVNSVSPQARNMLKKHTTIEPSDQASQAKKNESLKSKLKSQLHQESIERSRVANSERQESALKSPTNLSNDTKQITFEQDLNNREQGAGNMHLPEREIINFETNDNPEFKEAGRLIRILIFIRHQEQVKTQA